MLKSVLLEIAFQLQQGRLIFREITEGGVSVVQHQCSGSDDGIKFGQQTLRIRHDVLMDESVTKELRQWGAWRMASRLDELLPKVRPLSGNARDLLIAATLRQSDLAK